MLRVTIRSGEVSPVVLGPGETLLLGRSPDYALPARNVDEQLRCTAVALPRSSAHVSRLLCELTVGEEVVRLRWHGASSAQLSSLFDAPGGARRVALAPEMVVLLDEGDNQLVVNRGREERRDVLSDLVVSVTIQDVQEHKEPALAPSFAAPDPDSAPTTAAPRLERFSREWYVALALTEPWLTGADDYPRPPSNREIYERVLEWRGNAWNLERAQRVDDAIRVVARLAFGSGEDPFVTTAGRVQNVRFAVGRRAAETRLVTPDDLAMILRAQASGEGLRPDSA